MAKENYTHIMMLFDPNDELGHLCEALRKEQWPEEEDLKGKCPEDIQSAAWTSGLHIGFVVGYVLGQDFDINDTYTSRIVEDVRRRIIGARVLPFSEKKFHKKEEPQAAAKQI
jgi:hypothetical protein